MEQHSIKVGDMIEWDSAIANAPFRGIVINIYMQESDFFYEVGNSLVAAVKVTKVYSLQKA